MTLAMQRVKNERIATRINAYWCERATKANARVELLAINISKRFTNHDSSYSWEIVSDLTGRESPRLAA